MQVVRKCGNVCTDCFPVFKTTPKKIMHVTSLCSLLVVLVSLVAAGCASYKSTQIDPRTGQYTSLSAIRDDEITVNKPLPGVSDLPFVYVRTLSLMRRPEELDAFVRRSLVDFGFPKPISEEQLAQVLIKENLTGEVQSLTNILSLHRLTQLIGPFLVAEFRAAPVRGNAYRFEAVVFDPAGAQPVFVAAREGIVWVDFIKEFTNPMMNAVKSWYDDSAKQKAPADTRKAIDT